MKQIVLIPAYKPDKLMTALLEKLSADGFSVVVVNDGSGTGFEKIFDAARGYADVISHKENKGKGEALKTGLRYIKDRFEAPYIVVTADADGQHSANDIRRVAENAQKNPEALTLGVRQIDKAHMPFKNRSGNMFTRSAVFCVTGKYVSDSQTGLRGFSHMAIPLLLQSGGTGYEYEMNALIRWLRHKRKVSEVRIETIYFNNNASSHFRAVHDSARIYKEICRFFSASLIKLGAALLLFFVLFFCADGEIRGNLLFLAALNLLSIALGAGLKLLFNKAVFKTGVPMTRSKIGSAFFCVLYAAFSTLILLLMTAGGMGAVPAKLLTEFVMFVISWIMLKEVL